MAVTVDEVVVALEARLDKYTANLVGAQRTFEQTQHRIEGIAGQTSAAVQHHFREMGEEVQRSLLVFAGVEGIKKFVEAIEGAVKRASAMVDLAERIGVTTDRLQELEYQAKQTGSSQEALDGMLEVFSRNLGLAAAGSGNLLKILQANGIALKDNQGNMRPFLALLANYADLIHNASDEQARAVLSLEGFGRGAAEVSSVFGSGSQGIAKFADEAQRLSQVTSREALEELKSYERELVIFEGKWNALWPRIALLALNTFKAIGEGFGYMINPIIDAISHLNDHKGVSELVGEINDLTEGLKTYDDMSEDQKHGIPGYDEKVANLKALQEQLARYRDERKKTVEEEKVQLNPNRSKDDALPPPLTKATKIPDLSPSTGTSPEKKFAEDIKAIEARTRSLNVEAEAINKSRYEQEKALAVQELMNEAIKAGVAITPELKAKIDDLASGYANAVVNLEKLHEAQEKTIDRIDAFKDGSKDILKGFITDVHGGTSALEAMQNALGKIEDKLLDIVLSQAFDALFGQSGKSPANRGGALTGLLGSLIGSFFGGGGAGFVPGVSPGLHAKGGVSSRPAIFGEAGPEAAVPLPDGRRIPVDLRMPTVGGQQGQKPAQVIFDPEIVPPPGYETRIEEVPDGRGSMKPRLSFQQIVASGLSDRSTRRSVGLGNGMVRRG